MTPTEIDELSTSELAHRLHNQGVDLDVAYDWARHRERDMKEIIRWLK